MDAELRQGKSDVKSVSPMKQPMLEHIDTESQLYKLLVSKLGPQVIDVARQAYLDGGLHDPLKRARLINFAGKVLKTKVTDEEADAMMKSLQEYCEEQVRDRRAETLTLALGKLTVEVNMLHRWEKEYGEQYALWKKMQAEATLKAKKEGQEQKAGTDQTKAASATSVSKTSSKPKE